MITSPRVARSVLLLIAVCGFGAAGASFGEEIRCHERPGKIGYVGVSSLYEVEGEERRLRLVSVTPGSPAAEAGLRAGDVVVGIEGRPLPFGNRFEWLHSVGARRSGDVLRHTVRRGGELRTVSVKLAEPPPGWERRYLDSIEHLEIEERPKGWSRLQRLSAKGPVEITFHRDARCGFRSEQRGRAEPLPLALAAALRVVPLLERLHPGDSLTLEAHVSGNALRVEPAKLPPYLNEGDVVRAIQQTVQRDQEHFR